MIAERNYHRDEQILVVDDSRVQAKMLKDLLERNGYGVIVASDGQQALDIAPETRPGLLISDIVMPVMNGYEMCAALKNDSRLCHIPVILLTTLSDTEDILLGLKAQADYYLTKPYNADYLLSTIKSILQRPLARPCDTQESALEVTFGGVTHTVTASRKQMLNLLLSTYGNAVEQNRELLRTQMELKALNDQLRDQAQRIEEQQAKLQAANAQLQALATQDGLTGLKNHRAFKEKLTEELHRATRYHQPLSLLLIDVDRFKQFNDTFGHLAGDETLKAVARLLQEKSRESDFVARYGGEEFAILLPNTDHSWASTLAERLRIALEQASWKDRSVTASFGVASYAVEDASHPMMDADTLVSEADKALYHSKESGRNRVTHIRDVS